MTQGGERAWSGRRAFLVGGVAAGGLAALPLRALLTRRGDVGSRRTGPDYGPLAPVKDETTELPLLMLPDGFRYLSFGWSGDPLDDGTPTPPAHDGMAALAGPDGLVRIVRNHEVTADGGAFARGRPVYDSAAGGGTTTVAFDLQRGRVVRAGGSLTGTLTNCAGGPTPWGSWLTCEETLAEPVLGSRLEKPHGWVFEVPAGEATAEPLRAMGRFVHEAVAVDPTTGVVYLTEDRGSAGFYRFVPSVRERLEQGGKLQMLGVAGRARHDTRTGHKLEAPLAATWFDIEHPERAHHAPGDALGVFQQGFDQGGAVFARLEGAWFGDGRVYFVSTSGGNAGRGQVWAYSPREQELSLVFESPGAHVLDRPDNVTVSPRGGLVLCEDGEGTEYLHGLTTKGEIFRFAQNNVVLAGQKNGLRGDFTSSEFAGATYSPDGQWLFVNVQYPGITFAITGPWGRGAL